MIQETEAAASFIARFAKESSSSSGSATTTTKSCPQTNATTNSSSAAATSAQNNTNPSKVTTNTASSTTPPPTALSSSSSSSASSLLQSSQTSCAVSSTNGPNNNNNVSGTPSNIGLTNGSDTTSTTPPPAAAVPLSSTSSSSTPNPGTAVSQSNTVPISNEQIQNFIRSLSSILQARFRNHWFPDRPSRAQGYRCIRINRYNRVDSSIYQACKEAGIKYSDLKLPSEFTIWIDPNEVACRFGEHVNTHCIIAKFGDGRIENYVNIIDIDELEAQSFVQLKMHEYEIMNSRQKNKTNLNRSAANNAVPGPANGAQRTPHSTPSSSVYRSPHVNGTNSGMSNGAGAVSAAGQVVNGRLTGATSSPHVPVTSSGPGGYSMTNGGPYVDYSNGANGLMPVTSSSVVSLQQQYGAAAAAHAHAFTNGQTNGAGASANAGFFAVAAAAASAAGSPGPQFHQMAAAAAVVHSASNAFGSPSGQHIYQKFNHLAMSSQQQQQQQQQQQHSSLTNGRSMNGSANGNGLSMSPSDYQSVALDKDRRHMASAATAIVANRY